MNSYFMRSLTDALRYWEPRRILYNAVLAAVVLFYFALGYPASRKSLSLDLVLIVFLLAVLAKVAYCAAYIPDVLVQSSGYQTAWRKYRWVVFSIGLLFAAVLTRFLAMGMFLPASS
jgi:TRAP-type uncharacterized transport system fused permease subunit